MDAAMWPDFRVHDDLRRNGHAFRPTLDWPELRVGVDPDAAGDELADGYLEFLRSFDSGVRVLTRVEGPGLARVGDYFVIAPGEGLSEEHGGVQERTPEGSTLHGIFSARNNIAAAFNWANAKGYDPQSARNRQLDIEAATALKADLYVSDSPFALSHTFSRDAFACTPLEAMAVVGLDQRLRGRVVVEEAPFSRTLNLWQVEMIEAWALLPESLELFYRDRVQSDSQRWRDLIRVAAVRLERALRSRDQALARSIHPNHPFPFEREDALVERITVNLSAMFDALARAINDALNMNFDEWQCSFSPSKKFFQKLPSEVASVLSSDDARALLNAISTLRNTIHAESLGEAAQGDSQGRVRENYVVLPKSEAVRFREQCERLGTSHVWIAFDFDDLGLNLKPVRLIEDLIPLAVKLFQSLVAVVSWPGSPSPLPRRDDPEDWLHHEPTVRLVKALYGIGA